MRTWSAPSKTMELEGKHRRSIQKKTNQKENHTGKGVSVADERLKIFNQQNGDSSKLDIDDIREADGSIAGTRVTITLPNLG